MSSSNGEHQPISMNKDSLNDEQGSLVSAVHENKKKKRCSRRKIALSVCLIIVGILNGIMEYWSLLILMKMDILQKRIIPYGYLVLCVRV
jgi:hypothetical protein